MILPETLETPRLRLEPFVTEHAAALLRFYERNRSHLEPWEPERPAGFYAEAHHREAAERNRQAMHRDESARFAVFEREGREVIGTIHLLHIRRGVLQAGVVGYAIDAACCGRGYATEATGAVVRFAFEAVRLHRLETSYHPTNEASGKVLRKLGFAVEGYARDYINIGGQWRDAILVGLSNPGWIATLP